MYCVCVCVLYVCVCMRTYTYMFETKVGQTTSNCLVIVHTVMLN